MMMMTIMMMMMMMTMAMTLTWLNLQLTQWDFPFAQQLRKPPCQNKIKILYDDNDDHYCDVENGICANANVPG